MFKYRNQFKLLASNSCSSKSFKSAVLFLAGFLQYYTFKYLGDHVNIFGSCCLERLYCELTEYDIFELAKQKIYLIHSNIDFAFMNLNIYYLSVIIYRLILFEKYLLSLCKKTILSKNSIFQFVFKKFVKSIYIPDKKVQ